MYPWTTVDPSVVMAPPTYPFPMPVPVPPGPIPMHPSLQPFPFFRNPNPGALPNTCSTFLPYSSAANPQIDQPSTQYLSSHSQPSSRSHTVSKQESRSKSSEQQRGSNVEKSVDSNDVATELELKTPGSSVAASHLKSIPDQELSSEGRKGKRWSSPRKVSGVTDESCSSRCSSSRAPQDSSSNSVGDGSVAKN